MPRILLTPENLQAGASTVRECASNNDAVISEIENLIKNLALDWEGEAQKAFQSSYESKKATFKKFTDEMEIFASFLDRYAQTMQDQEDLQKGKAVSLG